jgi:antitoxin (DNA-binding transcriptional repressor) of toxin-antitoxin stability system
VRRGGTVRVFDREHPVADLVPCRLSSAGEAADQLLGDLEREGTLRRGTGSLPADFLRRKLPKAKASVLAALLDERSQGR